MSWFLRSLADHDTHQGELRGDGTVLALRFVSRPTLAVPGQPPEQQLADAGPALRGAPPDPDQICPDCRRGGTR